MIERIESVARVLRANARALGAGQVRVIRADALAWLREGGSPFDIVFLDPPFDAYLLVPSTELLVERGWLAPGSRVYLETAAHPDTGGRFLPGTDVVQRIGVDIEGANGEWIGVLMLSPEGAQALKAHYEKLLKENDDKPVHQAPNVHEAALTDVIQSLIDDGLEVRAIDTYKGWMEVDTFEDYRRAWGQVR